MNVCARFIVLYKEIGMAKKFRNTVAGASLCFILAGTLAGCAAAPSPHLTEAQKENRAYMSQINGFIENLSSCLDSFNSAVSRYDTVGMKAQISKISDEIDKLSKKDAPEVLAPMKDKYLSALGTLKTALNSYVDLYSAAQQGTTLTFTSKAYADKLAAIQKQYDEGLASLKEADAIALDLK